MWEWLTSPSTWVWFTEPFKGQNWWQILNAGFVGTVISSVVGIYVARTIGQVAKETEQATALVDAQRAEISASDALRDASEGEGAAARGDASTATAGQPQLDEAGRQAFATASSSIRRLKDYVDTLADRCRDGRTRRKYDNISRRDYRIITAAIGEDGGLESRHLEKLLAAFEEWRTYRNGRVSVPRDVAGRLQHLADQYRVTNATPPRWSPKRAEPIQP